jgi:hypothetical protein
MRLSLAVVAALAAVLVVAPAASARSVPQGFFGVMYDHGVEVASDEAQDSQWDLMASSGVETVRTVFDWADAQPGGRGTPFDFSRTDGIVRRAALHNLDVLPVVMYAPPWARAYRGRFTSPPKKRNDYVTYLAALVERYGPEGTYWSDHPEIPKHPVREWQIWNEPHLPAYWDAPERGPYGYTRAYPLLLRASYNIVKTLDPGAKIVLAGITQRAWEEIELLYQHDIKRYFDVAALQIFPQTVRRAVKATELYRAAMNRRGDRRKPIYVTEITWAASKGKTQPIKFLSQNTPRGMASKLGQMYPKMVARRRALGLAKVFWYTWSSPYGRGGSNFHYTGLLRFDGRIFTKQPALEAYQRNARRFEGCTKTTAGLCQ